MKFQFSENNSGGSWWLNKSQYEALFAAGWTLAEGWDEQGAGFLKDPKKPWSKGDDVPYGWRHSLEGEFPSMKDAVESWEKATGQDFFEEGCNCCGAPFSMHTPDYSESLSGDSVEREVRRPW